MTGPTCTHCAILLLPCPLGAACPGSHPYMDHPCRICFRGLTCPLHGDRWPN